MLLKLRIKSSVNWINNSKEYHAVKKSLRESRRRFIDSVGTQLTFFNIPHCCVMHSFERANRGGKNQLLLITATKRDEMKSCTDYKLWPGGQVATNYWNSLLLISQYSESIVHIIKLIDFGLQSWHNITFWSRVCVKPLNKITCLTQNMVVFYAIDRFARPLCIFLCYSGLEILSGRNLASSPLKTLIQCALIRRKVIWSSAHFTCSAGPRRINN